MRSIWKGAISFGLVTIPVKVYSATEQRDISFHQVHRKDAGRVKYRRVCTVCGEELAYSDIAKGYELPSGEIVVLTDEDFADLPLRTNRNIEVLQFTPLEQVDPIYFAKSYYLEPDAAGIKPYTLLRDALEQSGKVGVVKIALRQRESLAALRVRDGVFVLETMLWPDEIREPAFPFLEEDVEVRPQELTMATSLIETMAGDFDPTQYKDAYREALQAVIQAKVEGKEIAAPAAPEEEPAAADLLSALRASVEAAKRNRAGGGPDGGEPGAGKPRAAKSGRRRPDGESRQEASEEEAPKKAQAKKSPAKAKSRKSA
jgi:DNA end-binding protein Ku